MGKQYKKFIKNKLLIISMFLLSIPNIMLMITFHNKIKISFSNSIAWTTLLISIISFILNIYVLYININKESNHYFEFFNLIELILGEIDFNIKYINDKNIPIIKDIYTVLINISTNTDSKQNEYINSAINLINLIYLNFYEIKISNNEKYKNKLLKDIESFRKQLINNITKNK